MNIEKSFSFLLQHPYFDHANNLKNERWHGSHTTVVLKHTRNGIQEYLRLSIPFEDQPISFIYRRMNVYTNTVIVFINNDLEKKFEGWANETLHETIAKHYSLFRIRRLLKVDYDE